MRPFLLGVLGFFAARPSVQCRQDRPLQCGEEFTIERHAHVEYRLKHDPIHNGHDERRGNGLIHILPELTGRENVMLNGTLLGHTLRELEGKLDEIVDFAELGSFIEAPLRTYSSGMAARLGFAVATAWRPEILLVDEVLAVGDEAFQRKCLARMQAFRDSGATVLFVTHGMATVAEMCGRAAWLDHGRIRSIGPAAQVIQDYRAG